MDSLTKVQQILSTKTIQEIRKQRQSSSIKTYSCVKVPNLSFSDFGSGLDFLALDFIFNLQTLTSSKIGKFYQTNNLKNRWAHHLFISEFGP